MTSTSTMRRAAGLVVGVALAATFASAAVAEPGVSEDTIRIGTYGPFTGPVSLYGYPITNGAVAYYKKVNDEGGIHGRKIELVYEDGACDAAKTRAAVKKLVYSSDVLLVHGGSCSGAVYAARDQFVASEVPTVLMASVLDKNSSPTEKYIFTTTQPASYDGVTMSNFVTSIPDLKKVAIVKNTDDWAEAHLESIYERLEQEGVEIAADVVLERNASDATTQVMQVLNSGADAVLLVTYPNESAIFLREARKYGLDGPFVGASSDMDMMAVAERAGGVDFIKDLYVSSYLEGPVGSEEMEPYTEIFRKYFPDDKIQTLNFYGMSGAYAVVEALRRAGPEPTREKFIEAMESLDGIPAGPAYCEISFTEERHQGCLTGNIWGIRDGKVVTIGETWPAGGN